MFRMALRRGALGLGAAAAAGTVVQLGRLATMERATQHSPATAFQQLVYFDILRLVSRRARAAHDDDCEAFGRVQAQLLRERLEANKDTAYGLAHGFGDLLSSTDVVEAFRQRMPISTGADYAPWVERIAAGEPNVLNAQPETQLAATSGTSGKRTVLPNTAAMSSTFFLKGILVLFETLGRAVPGVFQLQRTCKLAFAPTWTTTPGGLHIGPNSSNPLRDKRLLLLYSTPDAGYTIQDEQAAAHVPLTLTQTLTRSLTLTLTLTPTLTLAPTLTLTLALRAGRAVRARAPVTGHLLVSAHRPRCTCTRSSPRVTEA